MRSVLLRTGSAPSTTSFVLGSPKAPSPENGIAFTVKNETASPKSTLQFELKDKDRSKSRSSSNSVGISKTFRRARSEIDLNCRVNARGLNRIASRSFTSRIVEEKDDFTEDIFGLQRELERKPDQRAEIFEKEEMGAFFLGRKLLNVEGAEYPAGIMTVEQALPEELEYSGGGAGNGNKIGGGKDGGNNGNENFTGGSADQSKIKVYYQEMLRANPTNPLLLRNYGKFLHEVEKDAIKAEEYYGRAILASPGDGEVLSLYAKLIWETHRDEERANGYFDQAIKAAPDDCYVLGSYAHFLWDAEDEDGTEEDTVAGSPSLVGAF